MKSRPTYLRRLLSKIFRRRAVPPPAPPRRMSEARVRSGIEPLEGRVAPAAFVNATTITFNDIDGDLVTVHFSKAIFDTTKTPAQNQLDNIFKFVDDQHAASLFASTGPQQLQLIDLSQVANVLVNNLPVNPAAGTDITVTAMHNVGSPGDALTNIGAIKASQLALGIVTIAGDLGQIDAGTPKSVVGIAALNVTTLGKFGATTQLSTTTAADALESKITGKLKSLIVGGDLFGYIHVVDGNDIVNNNIVLTAPAKIGAVTINGSLHGNATVAAASNNTGTIESAGTINTISILGTSATEPAGLVGGGGTNSGSIVAAKGLGSVNVSGALNGGAGVSSGAILAKGGNIGSLTIGAGLKGAVGAGSGSVQITGGLPLAAITGGLTGGAGANSGSIVVSGALDAITVAGGLTGGAGTGSGSIAVAGALTTATISGGLTGGSGDSSAVLSSVGKMGTVVVNGDLTGTGAHSGGVSAGDTLTSLIVNGKITGGGATLSGFVEGLKNIVAVRVTGDVTGGIGQNSASIVSGGDFTRLVIGGKLAGGQGPNSGAVFSGTNFTAPGTLAVVKVKGGIEGGDGFDSGAIVAGGTLGSAVIGTVAAPAKLLGGGGAFSGSIFSQSTIGSVLVNGFVQGGGGKNSGTIQGTGLLASVSLTGGLTGGAGDLSGSIFARDKITESGNDTAGDLGTIVIGGDIAGGAGVRSGRVVASGDLAALTAVALKGGVGSGSGSIITGRGTVHPGDALAITLSGAVTSTAGSVDPLVRVGGRLSMFTVGAGLSHADIRVGREILTATITGDIADSHLTALGQAAPLLPDTALASLVVTGSVSNSQILAGYDLTGLPVNADASIGRVKVTGNWTASDLVAGVQDVNGDGFGNADDVKISGGTDSAARLSQIAAVVVKGTIDGSAAGGDHFGFTAQQILAFKSGATALAFDALLNGQSFELGTQTDTTAREAAIF